MLKKYNLETAVPAAVDILRQGCQELRPETAKPGDALFERVTQVIVANNVQSIDACCRRAGELGYQPLVLSTTLEGEAADCGRVYAAISRECLARGRPAHPPACLLAGGETTVTVRGDGLGGRCQEFALGAATGLAGMPSITILAAGTDGRDGPTDAAGAFADGLTCDNGRRLGLDAEDYLRRNDCYGFLSRVDSLLKTGPSGTNVMDVYAALIGERQETAR